MTHRKKAKVNIWKSSQILSGSAGRISTTSGKASRIFSAYTHSPTLQTKTLRFYARYQTQTKSILTTSLVIFSEPKLVGMDSGEFVISVPFADH